MPLSQLSDGQLPRLRKPKISSRAIKHETSIIATAVAVVVGIIAGYGTASIIAKPIIKFRDIIRTIAEGDLTVEWFCGER